MLEDETQIIRLESEAALALWDRGREAWNAEAGTPYYFRLEAIKAPDVRLVLASGAAIALWRQGRDAWNAWVEANPRAVIDFSGVAFDASLPDPFGTRGVNFSGFRFPDSHVNFSYATFGKGFVDFSEARFGVGSVSFYNANFGNGGVSFFNAQFGDEEASFSEAKFGDGDVVFDNAVFGGGIQFYKAKFGTGDKSFIETRVSGGDIRFFETDFGDGAVSFNHSTFGKGVVTFYRTTLGEGDLSFEETDFGEGNVTFDDAKLGKGDTNFAMASFGPGSVSMRNLTFAGAARFDALRQLENCHTFSFEGCSFEKLFTFSHDGRMGCPLDLRRTKLAHGVVLNDVRCDYATSSGWLWRRRAADPEDSQRFRRLKELAQNENNRAKALEFNAQELRSQRGHETGWLQDFLQFFYMLLSDYGRSVVRPLVALGMVTGLFGAIYAQLSTNPKTPSFMDALPAALTYSGGNMFAFVPIGRSALEQSRADLFGDKVPYELLWIAGSQSVLSVILLFLLGLGLRNMFRL